MEIIIPALLTAAGLAMLCLGGNWLVSGGVNIAKSLGVSPLIIGMTIVAYGTSTPELAASLAATEHGSIILGNVVGSNIANVGMVIGISAVMASLAMHRRTLKKEIPIMIGVSILLVALSVDGEVSRYDGALLLGALVAFTLYIYRNARRSAEKTEPIRTGRLRSVITMSAGMALLAGGAWLAIENAVVIAQGLGLSEKLIGITVIAIGTSLPELITSVIAIRRGHVDIGIGNIIGSNIYNILMIMGVASAITGIAVAPGVFADYMIMIGFSLALLIGFHTGRIPRPAGIILAAAYIIYLAYSFLA